MTTNQQINATAYLMTQLRPEWDAPGCVAALRKLDLPLSAVIIAAVRYAEDRENLTPAHLADLGNRAWDSDWYPRCAKHPEQRARRTSGECASCFADRTGDESGIPKRPATPPPAPLRQLVAGARAELDARREATA